MSQGPSCSFFPLLLCAITGFCAYLRTGSVVITVFIFSRLTAADDHILRDMCPTAARSLASTGSLGHRLVSDFNKRAYRIDLFLRPFFTFAQYMIFQNIQTFTGPPNIRIIRVTVHGPYRVCRIRLGSLCSLPLNSPCKSFISFSTGLLH